MIKFERVKDTDYGVIPQRSTAMSAGYDFVSPVRKLIRPGDVETISTGIKCKMPDNMVLLIVPRSSMGIRRHLRLANTVGVIDSDYYGNADNDGNIMIALHNYGQDEVIIEAGERIAQGLFLTYHTGGERVDDVRAGGIGSTGVIYRAKS